jgi:hypothetical protein
MNRPAIVPIVIALGLITASCSFSINPAPQPEGQPPEGLMPGQPFPEQPLPEGPMPGQPMQEGPIPGQPLPEGPPPGELMPAGPPPEQPQPMQPPPAQQQPAGQQPGQAPAAQPTATKKPGSGQPAKTATSGVLLLIGTPLLAAPYNLDLAITNVYPASTGHIMVTIRNTGTVDVSGSYKVTCSGSYVDSTGNHALNAVAQYASVNLSPAQKADFDTSYSRNPSITSMTVTCKLTPPEGDSNSSNNSYASQVK